jgi:hypothetical protein
MPSQQDHPYLNARAEIIGIALVAAAVLGTAYFGYRAAAENAQAQNAPITCTTTEWGGALVPMWTANCR